MSTLKLWFEDNDPIDVRSFKVHEAMSSPFEVSLFAVAPTEDLDLDAIVGQAALFAVETRDQKPRFWKGIVSFMELVHGERAGLVQTGANPLSTYYLRLVPRLWTTTMRRENRIFQHLTVPEIVTSILREHGVVVEHKLAEEHPKQEYRVQFGESDYAFVSRLLEEEGISYHFAQRGGDHGFEPSSMDSALVLTDLPHAEARRELLPYKDNEQVLEGERWITKVRFSQEIRPGRHTIRDYDFKKPDFELFGHAQNGPEEFLEQYHYEHGAFTGDRGGARRAAVSLDGTRRPKRNLSFKTSSSSVQPGSIIAVEGHPRGDLSGHSLLVLDTVYEGSTDTPGAITVAAAFADVPHRPPKRTPRPNMPGLQSAMVVGPVGEEIHTDEFGRVKVQFHWDREGKKNQDSSCWVRVSQGWGGASYGMMAIPRVGQEVIIGFWEGNPDQPLVVGRMHNMKNQVPFKLPDDKTKSTWRSNTSPGGGGFNEIMFDDKKGEQLVYLQAERDMKHLVKRDRLTHIHEADIKHVGQHHVTAIGSPASKSSTFIEMFQGRNKLQAGMAMVLLEGDSVTITGLTVNILGMAEVNIVGGKIKLNS